MDWRLPIRWFTRWLLPDSAGVCKPNCHPGEAGCAIGCQGGRDGCEYIVTAPEQVHIQLIGSNRLILLQLALFRDILVLIAGVVIGLISALTDRV